MSRTQSLTPLQKLHVRLGKLLGSTPESDKAGWDRIELLSRVIVAFTPCPTCGRAYQ